MYIKRTLILSKIGDEDKKALATIQKGEGEPYLQIKLQNENVDNLFLVIRYNDSPIELVQLNKVGNYYEAEIPRYFDYGAEIYIAVLQLNSGKLIPFYLGGGQSQRQSFYSEVLKDLNYFQNQTLSITNQNNQGEQNIVVKNSELECSDKVIDASLFEEPTENEIDDIITDTLLTECLNQKDKCENCIYKKAFYESQKDSNDKKEKEASKNTYINNSWQEFEDEQTLFYNQIKKSLDSLFEAYPSDTILQNAIEDSEFVKVDYEDTGDYYSVGYIKENEVPKYICYAIPCKPNSPPPKDMQEFSQYLPVNDELAYYLMYQNASDGETIKINTL